MPATITTPDISLPKTYFFSRKMKALFWFLGPIGIGAFSCAAAYFVLNAGHEHNLWTTLIFTCLAIGMAVVFAIGFFEIMHCSMTIHPDRIQFIEVYGEREFLLSEIAGYRVRPQGQGVNLILKERPRKKVPIPSNLEHFDEIIRFLDAHFKNLDAEEFHAEEETMLANADLGATPDERREKLERTRKFLKQGGYVCMGITLWTLAYPRPYGLAIAISALLPLVAITILFKLQGVVHLDDDSKGAHPSVVSLFMPATALAFRAFADFNLVDVNDTWVPAGTLLALISVIVFLSAREYRSRPLQFLPVLFFLTAYSYGLTIECNCLLDSAAPKIHTPSVLAKRISTGKTKTYYFTVSRWGERKSESEIQVLPVVYNAVHVGDTVLVHEMPGVIDIRWFYTRTKNGAESS